LKVIEVRDLPIEELATLLDETKEELFNLRFQHATGQLENYKRLGQVRRDVARMETVVKERELGIVPEPAPEELAARPPRPQRPPRRSRRKAEEEKFDEESGEAELEEGGSGGVAAPRAEELHSPEAAIPPRSKEVE
jgi:large subunit ribosomal protein L29